MKTMSPEDLKAAIKKHRLWLNDEEGGERLELIGFDLSWSDLSRSNLSWSNLSGSDLSGSNLSWSNLSGSNLRGSDLRGSDLSRSNLSWSNLSGSNLSWSNLSGSNLRGSDLRGSYGTYYITQRTDGYQFFLCEDDGKYFIRAGCRYMSIADYREHTRGYSDLSKQEETLLILDYAEAKLNSILKQAEAA